MKSFPHTRLLAVVALFFSAAIHAGAQKIFSFNRHLDSVLTVRYRRADIDTAYIMRPQTKWTLIARLNVSGSTIEAEGNNDGQHFFRSEMNSDYKSTLCAGVSYLGLSLSMALNPAKLLGKYKDYELNFQSYSPRYGFDIAYQDAHNFTGWYSVDGERQDFSTSADVFKLRTLNVNGYYVFNHRRFSYPAAFAHSYIQRRSAGSFLLAASGQGQHGNQSDDGQALNFKMTNIGIGAGYGYNYVPANGWLLHISSLPTFIVYSNTSLTLDGTRIPLNYHFPEVIITGRGAIVKQIGGNKFLGLSMVYNFTNIGYEDRLSIHNQKWRTRLYFGIRM